MIPSLSLLQGSLRYKDSPFPLLEIQSASENQFLNIFYKAMVYGTPEIIVRGHVKMNHRWTDTWLRKSDPPWCPGTWGQPAPGFALRDTEDRKRWLGVPVAIQARPREQLPCSREAWHPRTQWLRVEGGGLNVSTPGLSTRNQVTRPKTWRPL